MPRKYRHNLSFTRLMTGSIGELIPVGLVEVVPGDTFRHSASVLVRLSPLAAPVMHPMTVRIDHFFVPHRCSWVGANGNGTFEDFITGGEDGRNSATIPTAQTTGETGDLFDYFGCPPGQAGVSVSALPIAAYNEIYNEWYRDQDLIPKRSLIDSSVANIAWEKDYYTAARPWPQKGEEVTLPLGEEAPVLGIGKENTVFPLANQNVNETGQTATYDHAARIEGLESNSPNSNWFGRGTAASGLPHIVADLRNATAVTIQSLRLASALQRFAEARARWGSRYAEYVRHEFGARPLDARLQRPEYLGGGRTPVSISEVLQTAPDPSTTRYGVGDMYGHAIAAARSNRYRVKFAEHGYVISLFSVRPKAMYANGIERTLLRRDREDFYQPQLAHIGQQQVLTQEVFATSTNASDVFGWNDRYYDYREVRSAVTGQFRTLLDYWHLSRKFPSAPALNQAFVEVNPADTKRIFNEQDNDSLWVQCNHKLQALRPIPRNATPRLL